VWRWLAAALVSVALIAAVAIAWRGYGLERASWLAAVIALITIPATLFGWARRTRRESAREQPPSTTVNAGQLADAPRRPAWLPPDTREFTGRERELRDLRALLTTTGDQQPAAPVIVTISGKPGVGKSVLAVHFAHQVRHRYPDAQLYVDLQGDKSDALRSDEVLVSLVQAVGSGGTTVPTDVHSLSSSFRTEMDGRRAILVLDNVASEAQVRPLLPAGSSCLVIITSRRPLDGLTGASQLHLDVMPASDAIRLLVTLAGEQVGRDANLAAASEVAAQCGYLPLPLSIAAAQIRKRSAQEVAKRLKSEHRRLDQLKAGDKDVRASFDVSYGQLTPEQRTLWRRLRLLPELRFTARLAAALLDRSADRAVQLLDELVDEQVLEIFADRRYGFHDLIGLYADEKRPRRVSRRWPAPSPGPIACRCAHRSPPRAPSGPS